MLPQGSASPYIINLIFLDRLLVAASTERSLDGVDVRKRGVPHRYIGGVGASLIREVLVGPRTTSAESMLSKHGKPFKPSLDLLPTIVGAKT